MRLGISAERTCRRILGWVHFTHGVVVRAASRIAKTPHSAIDHSTSLWEIPPSPRRRFPRFPAAPISHANAARHVPRDTTRSRPREGKGRDCEGGIAGPTKGNALRPRGRVHAPRQSGGGARAQRGRARIIHAAARSPLVAFRLGVFLGPAARPAVPSRPHARSPNAPLKRTRDVYSSSAEGSTPRGGLWIMPLPV